MGTPKWPKLEPEGPVVSHMEAQGRPRTLLDAEMGPQRAKIESQGNQKESKGSPKRVTGGAKWTPRGSWKDAACGPKINGKHKAKQRFCEVRATSSVPKGIRKMPSERPSGQRRARDSKAAPQDPSWTPKGTPREPKGTQKSYVTFAASTRRSQDKGSGGSPPL